MRIAATLSICALATGSATASEPVDGALGFQPPATELADSAFAFHDLLLLPIISVITLVVMGLLLWVMVRYNKRSNPEPSKTTHNTLVEVVWTTVPVLILVVIAAASFPLLYKFDRLPVLEAQTDDPDAAKGWLNIKTVGSQWKWEYIYQDYEDADGYEVQVISNPLHRGFSTDTQEGLRNLSVDYPMVVPAGRYVRYYTAARDVIHSFAMPAFGIKTDAIPGRLNEGWFKVDEPGVYYGQCSELCGVDHAFMPIEIRVVDEDVFERWIAFMQSGDPDAANAVLPQLVADKTGAAKLASAQ